MKRFVITGGPGTGKTTICEALKERGYTVIPEAARMFIEQHEFSSVRSEEFQVALTRFQQDLELKETTKVAFLDRSIIDNVAFCEALSIPTPQYLLSAAQKTNYDLVFTLQPLPKNLYDRSTRPETYEEALRMHSIIQATYKRFGYTIVEVPCAQVEERVKYMLARISWQ